MSGPLTGIRVVDITHAAVGPWASALMAEMGADVIHVEPPEGDMMQRNPPPYKNGITSTYIAMNVSKRDVKWDLHDEDVKETMRGLVQQSDILVENHRPGFLDRRGLGWEDVHRINPRLIYCASSGYGSRGPYKQMGSVDPYGQAVSGFASVSGSVGARPEGVKGGAPADLATSQYIVAGLLAALYNREITGLGQFVDTSQMQALTAFSGARAMEYFVSGQNPEPLGTGVGNIVPSRAYLTSDRRYLNVSAVTDDMWQRLCRTLDLPGLAADARLPTNAGRLGHRNEIDAAIEGAIATESLDHWMRVLAGAGVPCGPYLTHNNLRIHEQVRQQRMIEDVYSPWGRITVGGMPWHFSRTPGEIRPTHLPGQDNERIIEEFPPSDAPAPVVPPKRTNGLLEGLRVVDLTQGYVGYCGMLFADLGATVTKVEPHEGDYLRRLGPPDAGQDSAAFLAVNRSKRSVTLDWTTDAAARAKLDSLIAHADVVISDLQPSEATRHGLTYAALETGHARLVLCSLTPFGDSGPLADHPATELEIQGMSAQWRYLGEMGKEPVRHGLPMSALCGSLFAFQGILAALYERARSERGQKVEVTQLGAQITMQSIMWAAESEPDEWIGHCVRHLGEPARGYATADRSILFGFRSAEDGLREFCGRIGAPEIMDRFEPSNWNWQEEHRALFEEAFKTHSADELVAWVRELGGDAVQYHTYETLAQDPQALAIGLVSEYEYPGIGRFGTTGLAWEFSNSPAKHGRPPLLGEHNADLDA